MAGCRPAGGEAVLKLVKHWSGPRTVGVATIALLIVGILVAPHVLLSLFAAMTLAVSLRSASDWVSKRARWSPAWSLLAVVVFLISVFGLSGWLVVPSVAEHTGQLFKTLPESARSAAERLEGYGWGREILGQLPDARRHPSKADS